MAGVVSGGSGIRRRSRGGTHRPQSEINITPMVDLTFVLLLIFIIMTTASVQGVKVNLPQASSAASLAAPKTKPWGQTVAYVRCPDGTLVELCTPIG